MIKIIHYWLAWLEILCIVRPDQDDDPKSQSATVTANLSFKWRHNFNIFQMSRALHHAHARSLERVRLFRIIKFRHRHGQTSDQLQLDQLHMPNGTWSNDPVIIHFIWHIVTLHLHRFSSRFPLVRFPQKFYMLHRFCTQSWCPLTRDAGACNKVFDIANDLFLWHKEDPEHQIKGAQQSPKACFGLHLRAETVPFLLVMRDIGCQSPAL